MQLTGFICAFTGMVVWCVAVAAIVLALGGNLHCQVERAPQGVILAVCQSPAFDRQP
jgi:hypothetical protein